MLIKIKNFDISTPKAVTITLSIMNDDNTISTLSQSDFEAINLETYFIVKNDTKSTTIDLATVAPIYADKTVTLTFDSTVAGNQVANGDLLTIGRGSVRVPVTTGTGILNTTTHLYNKAGDGLNLPLISPTKIETEVIAPPSNFSSTTEYQISVNLLDINGKVINSTPVTLDAPFKVAGSIVATIKLTKNFNEATVFAIDEKVSFKVEYFDILGEPLSISVADKVSISAFAKRKFD